MSCSQGEYGPETPVQYRTRVAAIRRERNQLAASYFYAIVKPAIGLVSKPLRKISDGLGDLLYDGLISLFPFLDDEEKEDNQGRVCH